MSRGLDIQLESRRTGAVYQMNHCLRRPSTEERTAEKVVANCRFDETKARTVLIALYVDKEPYYSGSLRIHTLKILFSVSNTARIKT
jgi:hypothetical protein